MQRDRDRGTCGEPHEAALILGTRTDGGAPAAVPRERRPWRPRPRSARAGCPRPGGSGPSGKLVAMAHTAADSMTFPTDSQEFRTMFAEVSRAWELLPRINAVAPGDFAGMRAVLAELTGRELDESVRVLPPFHPDGGRTLRFGRNVFVNHGCTIVAVGGVEIGDDVMIGPNVQLVSGGHPLDPKTRRSACTCAPIRIGRGVWIGAGATVLQGVVVGDDAVVAAGAVVTGDVPPRTVVGGVPARVIRRL